MYTRSFPQNEGIPPEDYRGTALGGVHNEISPKDEEEVSAHPKRGALGGIFEKLPFLSGVRLPFFESGAFKLGIEELLIIAAAALLFFSEGGDKECAIILILLLFVG